MNPLSQPEETVADADPFAADIFASKQASAETDAAEESDAPQTAPVLRLFPKAAPAAIDWNDLLSNLPNEFSESLPATLISALQDLLFLPPTDTDLEILPSGAAEINRSEDFPRVSGNSWWLGIEVFESDGEIVVEIDNAFAVWLVDRMLDAPQTLETIHLRDLTETETAVLEFLALNLTHRANQAINAPVFKFDFLQSEFPAFLKNRREMGEPLLAVNFEFVHAQLQSAIKVYVAPESLQNLQIEENRFLDTPPRRFDKLARRVENLRARILFGEAELSIAEIAALEKADVILLENYSFSFYGGRFSGRAEICLGDAREATIVAEWLDDDSTLSEPDLFADNQTIIIRPIRLSENLKFMIEDLPQLENFPDDNSGSSGDYGDGEIAEDGGGIRLENLAVKMRVELEAGRLSLAEIANLRVNQVLELGTSGGTVNLLVGERVVGRGELVAVENRLGVRIVKLYG